MATWTARTSVSADPDEVLALLTEPDAIARWAPIGFEVIDFDGERLQAGDRVAVRGTLGGRGMEFEVQVSEAEDGHLQLTARGPIRLDVEYRAVPAARGSEVRASVKVSGGGLFGRLLAQATDALLAAGALTTAVNAIARELELQPALAA
ncbi:MAG TPA: SRPBCC family protein [Solirubrobacteraceae bacterium]|nr:SRPBCC family protein [Solirubrobacteraceae bacterium]